MELKKGIKKLEEALNVNPLFMTPLGIQAPKLEISTPNTPHILNKLSHLLNGLKSFIVSNINKRLNIIEDAWEVAFHVRNLT